MNNDVKKGGGEGEGEKHYMKDATCPLLSHKLPPDVNEIAYVIARVYKYGNINDYAEKLIREDIEKRRKSSDDTEDSLKQYINSVLSSSTSSNMAPPDDDSAKDDDNRENIRVILRLKKTFAYVLRLLAKHYDEGDIDKFTSEEVSKIICALAESSSSTILGPSISVELEQHIQSLLKDEKT